MDILCHNWLFANCLPSTALLTGQPHEGSLEMEPFAEDS